MFINKRDANPELVVYEYYFDDLVELTSYVKTAKINTKIFNPKEISSIGNDYSWYKTRSFDEALTLCLGGDDEMTNIFNEENAKFASSFPYLSQKRNIVTSYYGHRPNVSKYLTSNPKCMYKLERNEPYNVVDVHYNVSASHGTPSSSIFNRGIITINMIKFLESLGYRVRFNFFELTKECEEHFYISVNLKRPEEKISPSICYFPMCNPSFLRRIIFRVKESTDFQNYDWFNTYGKVLTLSELQKKYEQIAGINMDNCILIGNPRYMGISGRDIYEDAQNFFETININKYLGNNSMFFDDNSKTFTLKRKR